MDNARYINIETFEILSSPVNYIPCDKEIADVVAILNSKGYKTIASCAGHNRIQYGESFELSIDEFDSYNEAEKKLFKVIRQDDKKIIVKPEMYGESTYISFARYYEFQNIPEEFTYEKNKNGTTTLRKEINFYDSFSTRKDDSAIDEELKRGWEELKKWALSLEEYKIKER